MFHATPKLPAIGDTVRVKWHDGMRQSGEVTDRAEDGTAFELEWSVQVILADCRHVFVDR